MASKPSKPRLYYLQCESAGYCGDSPMWWRKGGSGYTPRIDEAEQFTSTEATNIIRSTRGSHRWRRWPVSWVDRRSYRTADIQELRKGSKA